MIYIGIDPGLTGGMAAIDEHSTPIFVGAFRSVAGEFDAHQFADVLTDIRIQLGGPAKWMAALEKVHAMPGQGVSSMFKFGSVFGAIKGVLAAKAIPYELITPQAWMKIMFAGENSEGKERGKSVAQRLFPEVILRETPRCRTNHSGMSEALLIAEFLRRKHLGLLS